MHYSLRIKTDECLNYLTLRIYLLIQMIILSLAKIQSYKKRLLYSSNSIHYNRKDEFIFRLLKELQVYFRLVIINKITLFGNADLGYDISSGNFTTSWQEWMPSVIREEIINRLIIFSLNLNKDSDPVVFITSVNGHAVNYKKIGNKG